MIVAPNINNPRVKKAFASYDKEKGGLYNDEVLKLSLDKKYKVLELYVDLFAHQEKINFALADDNYGWLVLPAELFTVIDGSISDKWKIFFKDNNITLGLIELSGEFIDRLTDGEKEYRNKFKEIVDTL